MARGLASGPSSMYRRTPLPSSLAVRQDPLAVGKPGRSLDAQAAGRDRRASPGPVGSRNSPRGPPLPEIERAHCHPAEIDIGFPSPRRTGGEPSMRREYAEYSGPPPSPVSLKTKIGPVGRDVPHRRPVEPGEVPLLRVPGGPGQDARAQRVVRDERAAVARDVLQRQVPGHAGQDPARTRPRDGVEGAIAAGLRRREPDLARRPETRRARPPSRSRPRAPVRLPARSTIVDRSRRRRRRPDDP